MVTAQKAYLDTLVGAVGNTTTTFLTRSSLLFFNSNGMLGTPVLDAVIVSFKRAAGITAETDQQILAMIAAFATHVLVIENTGTAAAPVLKYPTMISADLVKGRIKMALAWMADERRCPGASSYCPKLHAYQRAAAAAAAAARGSVRE